jgi:hypothetical protein
LDDPAAFLELAEIFPPSLRENDRLGETFTSATRSLATLGPIGAVEKLG